MGEFFGRQEELRFLERRLADAESGNPGVLFLEGEPGMGKTALLEHFRASLPGGAHYIGPRGGAGEPYDPIRLSALACTSMRYFARFGGRRKALESGRPLLHDWIGALPGIGDLAAALTATIDALQRRRRKGNVRLIDDEEVEELISSSRRRTTALLLDDLHLATPTAIGRLESLIRFADSGTRLLIVAAFRPALAGAALLPVQQLSRLRLNGRTAHLRLRSLGREELLDWASSTGALDDPVRLVDESLLPFTGGHPRAVRETLAALGRAPAVGAARATDVLELHIPLSESHAIQVLPIAAAETLRQASILGLRFDGWTLARFLERDELMVEDHLALAAHHSLVVIEGEEQLPNGEISTRYRFSDSHLRSTLYHSLPPGERKGPRPEQSPVAPPP